MPPAGTSLYEVASATLSNVWRSKVPMQDMYDELYPKNPAATRHNRQDSGAMVEEYQQEFVACRYPAPREIAIITRRGLPKRTLTEGGHVR